MASDPVIEVFNNKYSEARTLYEGDRLDEAVEKAERLLENEGMTRIYTREDCLLTSARYSSISSHQMLHAYCGMRG